MTDMSTDVVTPIFPIGDEADETVRRTIKALMKGRGLTTDQVARITGIGRSALYAKLSETGRTPFKAGEVATLARLLRVRIDKIYDGLDGTFTPPSGGGPGAGLYVLGKGGKPALLPPHPLILAAGAQLPKRGWWFPSYGTSGHVTSGAVTGATHRLFAAHGIEGSIHRCRHTYGTNLLRNGANLRVVQQLMRHSSLATTEIYTQVTNDALSAAILTLGAA
jgi:transcriptional regulator with XRE-family HTH domain